MESLRRLATRSELVPGLLAVAVFVAWDAAEGGYPATALYPGALFLLGLLVVTALGFRFEMLRIPAVSAWALALFGAFTVWSFASIVWADASADAWDGANRTLLYLTVFALFTIPRWRPSTAAVVLGAYSLGVAAVGAVLVINMTASSEPELMFNGSRLAEPTGYTNAVAGLFAAAVWPALFLASRRETPWPARGALMAAAGLLIQLALIPQSRGAFIVFPLVLVLYVAIVPDRVRSVLVLVPVGVATALAAPAVADVFTVIENGGDLGAAVDRAGQAISTSFVSLLIVGALLGLADRRIRISPGGARVAGRAVGATAAVGAIAGVVLVLGVIGNPVTWADDRWADFKGGYDPQGFGGSRLSGDLGSGRYDFWRVALSEEFADSPIVGAGTDNFAVTYLRERETLEEPLYPHSFPIQLLAGTGIVGAALFLSALVLALVAAARVQRAAGSSFQRGVSAAAIVAFAYWLGHSSGDWLWSFPGLAAPALAWLAIAGRIAPEPIPPDTGSEAAGSADRRSGRRSPGSGPGGSGRARTVVAAAAGVLVVGFAVVSYALPWAATRDVEAAESSWPSDPGNAFDRLDRARRLNFLSSEPDVVASAIAGQLGERGRMRAFLQAALEREPTNWYALLELGVLDANDGRRAAGVRRLRRAVELNPRDSIIRLALRRARSDEPLSLERLDRTFQRRLCGVVGRTAETRFCN